MTSLENSDNQKDAQPVVSGSNSWLHNVADEMWRGEQRLSNATGMSTRAMETSAAFIAAAVLLPELGGKALSLISREMGEGALGRAGTAQGDKVLLDIAEKKAADVFPGNDRARQLLVKQATQGVSTKEQYEIYNLYSSQKRSPELNQLLDRYFADDPSVHLLQQDEAQKVMIAAGDTSDHTFITQNLTACKASLTVVEAGDGARTAVFTHFQPGRTTENLSQLKDLLPKLGKTETSAVPKVFMFVPEDAGWPLEYRTSMFGPAKVAKTTTEATDALVDRIESTLGRKVNLTVSPYPHNDALAEWHGEKGTVRLTLPGDRSKPINFKTWYSEIETPAEH